jgi:hypothetical protein
MNYYLIKLECGMKQKLRLNAQKSIGLGILEYQ